MAIKAGASSKERKVTVMREHGGAAWGRGRERKRNKESSGSSVYRIRVGSASLHLELDSTN